MADENTAQDETPVTFHVKSSGNAKYTLTLPPTTTALDLKNKLAAAEYANIPADNQRLIYSGRVLKDADTLATHKVKEGHTMHLVKSAPSNQRQNPATQSSSNSAQTSGTSSSPAPPSGVPTNLATGTGNNPLAGLTGARYAGFAQLPGAGMFGPDGGMGPPPSSDQVIEMMSNPQFSQMMNEALQNPAMIDMMIQQNPSLRALGPQARQILQSEQFRRMMTDPEALRQAAQMQRAFGMRGPLSGGAQNTAFPAPGVTNTTDPANRPQETQNQSGQQPNAGNTAQNPFGLLGGGAGGDNPFAALFNPNFAGPRSQPAQGGDNQNTTASPGTGGPNTSQPQQNPFAALFNPALFGQPSPANQNSEAGSPPPQQFNPFSPQNNPFLNNPEAFAGLMQAMGGNGGNGASGGNPLQGLYGGFGGASSPPAPADTRPPEERYADQLRQLNDMGFYDFDRNIQALSRSGGSVQGAIEHLLGGS